MRTLFRTCEILVIAFISCAGTLYSQTSPSAERAVDRIVAAEQRLLTRLQDLSPVVEIYVQSTQPDRDGGRPLTDAYFLGQLDSHPKANRGQSVGPSVRLLFGKNRSERKIRFFSGTVRTLYPEGFAVMLFPDMEESSIGSTTFSALGLANGPAVSNVWCLTWSRLIRPSLEGLKG